MSLRRSPLAALAALALLLAACGSTPPIRHYGLGPVAPVSAASAPAAAPAGADPGVVIGPVSLPDGIDRLQIVRRIDGSRIDIADSHRWAGTLKHDIARRAAGEVARQIGLLRVVGWPQSSLGKPGVSVPVDIQRFDADGFDRVTLDAVWAVRRDGRDVASGRYTGSEPIASPDYEALTAAHGRLVDALARDIAVALQAHLAL